MKRKPGLSLREAHGADDVPFQLGGFLGSFRRYVFSGPLNLQKLGRAEHGGWIWWLGGDGCLASTIFTTFGPQKPMEKYRVLRVFVIINSKNPKSKAEGRGFPLWYP